MARKGAFATARDLRAGYNSLLTFLAAAVLQAGGLAVDATAEKFKTTTTFIWRRGNIQFSKAATTALTFSANHVITAAKFGVVLVQITDAGVISTKVPGATQTTAMAYGTSAAALAAKPAVDAGNTEMGYLIIENNAGDWTANTDDLTAASDITAVTFTNATVVTAPSAL